jgi:hypothetical protein
MEGLVTDTVKSSSGWNRVKRWLAGLTGVLLVVPSLINAGIDVYKAALNVPRTESESVNSELFQKYFNKSPVVTIPIPVKQSTATIDVKLSVYEGGDIYVEYGHYTHWFPFPKSQFSLTPASVQFFPNAIAQVPSTAPRGEGRYVQEEKFDDNHIVRKRAYANGVLEISTIDKNTGRIVSSSMIRQTPQSASSPGSKHVEILNYPVVDLEALKKNRQPN